MAGKQFWLVPVEGFDDQVARADTSKQARYAVFAAGREAGYFAGRRGFQDFLYRSGSPKPITEAEARARIGHYKAAGEE